MSSPVSGASWRVESDDRGIRTLWFDQPWRSFNLLDWPAFDELESHLADLEADASLRGCIIRSGKPGGFCAGIDAYARLLRSSDAWARLWSAESLGAPADARAICRAGCELLIERLEPAVASRAAAQAMLDVVNGATRRALRDGTEIPTDEVAAIALRPVASATEIRAAVAGATRLRRPARPRLVELEYEAGRLPDPAARKRLERIIAEAGKARDGLTLWRAFMALAPSHVDSAARDDLRDLIVVHLPHSLHFGVPLAGAMRLA